MKKLTIQFDGHEIGDGLTIYGFETSEEMLCAVSDGYVATDEYLRNFQPDDILFDYETGTRWKVVEVEDDNK